MMKILGRATLLVLIAGASACTSVSYRSPVIPAATTSIDGDWVDPNGIVSSFRSGTFQTRTTDTDTLLAQGNYVQSSPRLVEIELTSLLRNTTSKVNCALINPTQLNCTSSTGAQFTLVRI